ncbi:NAD(P)H nitroreductase [Nocardia sp. NPDC006630]|uniref:Acg family FMN-binding oxidoreductase n=1 Tax=Nocardia sp. NPDC006630 TaxID=3157181 RepID=UPI0033BC7E50
MSQVPTGETIERAVRLAGRAPSLHNSQPWHWVFDGTVLRLHSDRTRLLPSTDTSGRQLLISCGVALGHLRAALAAAGWRAQVAYFPNPTQRDHLATVRFLPAHIVTDADRDRAAAIERRRTDRLPFETPVGWQDFETVLRTVVDPDDAVLTVLPDTARAALAHASLITASLRRYDAAYQAELQWWAGHSHAAEGIPASALISREERERVSVGRTLPTVSGDSRRTEVADDRSSILVLSTTADTPEELVRCGEALSTVLLECTAAGYATCPLTNMTELPHGRAIVRDLVGGRVVPQVLVRAGTRPDTAPPPAATPRRPLPDILEIIEPEQLR